MKKHLYLLTVAFLASLALLFSFIACSSNNDDVHVTGVTLNKTYTSIATGATEQLTASVQPADATNKSLSWQSSDNNVATVSDGLLNALAPGQALITVTALDGDFSAACTVIVFSPSATGVSLNKTDATILAGQNERLIATVTPPEANQSVTWASDNPGVASIARESDGTVISVAPGTANITATSADGKITSAPCEVTVMPNVIVATGVAVFPEALTLTASIPEVPPEDAGGATAQLSAVILPPNAPPTDPPTGIVWSVSDATKASVTSTGRVTALAGGKVDIIATAGEISGSCSLTVIDPIRVTGISVVPDTATIWAGETRLWTATVAPSNATYPGYNWSSGDTAIATVSNTGLVTGQSPGTVTITATTIDGGHPSSSTVTVIHAPVIGVSLSPAATECMIDETVQLTANLVPAYANNRNVTWDTSDASVATVTQNGLVTGHRLGEATITVTTEDGGFKSDCTVTVVTELTVMNVYTSGYNLEMVSGIFPVYRPIWSKNDEAKLLDPTATDWGWGYGVSVDDNGDVYVAGWNDQNVQDNLRRRQAVLWKNGVPIALGKPFGTGSASTARAIYISGTDIYVGGLAVETLPGGAGYIYHPCIWKNDLAPQLLPIVGGFEGCITSLTAVGANVYAVGYDTDVNTARPHAVIWINGVPSVLPEGARVASWATSVSVSGDNVYVVGYTRDANDNNYPALWKNGVLQTLTPCVGTDEGYAASVFADGEKVYVAGYSIYRDTSRGLLYTATLWEDGVPTALGPIADHRTDSQALSVHVYRGNVFVSGVFVDYYDETWDMLYWKKVRNSFERNIITPPPATGRVSHENYPYSIFVSSH